jgi:hypothetical protein
LRYTKSGYSVSRLAIGFDGSFNPICQIEGPLRDPQPAKEVMTDTATELAYHGWMNESSSSVFKGDRLSTDGLLIQKPPWRISITRMINFLDRWEMKIWALTIEREE